MNKFIANTTKLTLKEAHNLLSTKHINAPSCRDCKFSIWSLVSKSKKHEYVELKCTKFPYKNKNLNTGIVYQNAFDCRIDTSKCGIEAKHYEPINVAY